MTIVAVLQARTTSSRLPGKVLADLEGAPMLARQIERVRRAASFSEFIVATSNDEFDDELAALCDSISVPCFRGSLNDVLDRFYQAALPYRPAHVVRLTGDCPMSDPEIIDAVVAEHLRSGADYTSNTQPPTYPDGVDVEVARFEALSAAHLEARLPSEREHVMPFITTRPDRFRLRNVAYQVDLSGLRWTVDEPNDLAFARAVYAALYSKKPTFGMQDILALLRDKPEVQAINTGIQRNEGLMRSLAADAAYKAGKG